MNEQVEAKKGMSKGCLVALIVLGVIILIIGALAVTCYVKRDAFLKFGVSTLVNGVKVEAMRSPDIGADSVVVNAVADAFMEKFQAEEINREKMQAMAVHVQEIMADTEVNSEEIKRFVNAMIEYYPELAELVPPSDSTADEAVDSTSLIE